MLHRDSHHSVRLVEVARCEDELDERLEQPLDLPHEVSRLILREEDDILALGVLVLGGAGGGGLVAGGS